uniref:C-C motif chemokine n=1 Tax=Aotus nancymaae TaxID=37293 RepID=A0A2K5CYE5_AOTNA|nr:C-C motif chemokine 16 [Aotus nancymaae]
MKVSKAALSLLVLILMITSASCSQPKVPEGVNIPPTCCLKYNEKVLPRRLVIAYRRALNCYLPAIIFITKKNREVCSNPNDDWVQEYIKDPNLPLLPSRNLATVKIITANNGQPKHLNSQ